MKNIKFIVLIFLHPLVGVSQNSVEFSVGIGATVIDIESLVEKDEIAGAFATDWEVINYGISGQYFFGSKGNVSFGSEVMYQSLYWYSVAVPFGSQTIYREYSVSAIKITPILRYEVASAFVFDIGPELNIMDGVKLGLLLSANYYIPVSDKVDIPIKIRFDIMKNIVITVPSSLNAGIRIKL
ncbi:MAG: hypothetical protein OEW67_13735 [Cyclobacteriaceae bacterium]|nr:hypothetical protein [Cyclobacteriaceae bacterium]